jgi:hypothetical protein
MVNSVFLKTPRRIAALMMVMTLCLLVYNVAQHKLRSRLKETGETLPNQLEKPVENPTLRWISQIMKGLEHPTFRPNGMPDARAKSRKCPVGSRNVGLTYQDHHSNRTVDFADLRGT